MPANQARAAADLIEAARERHVPVLTIAEASRRAGITPDGWRKVIKTGRGRQSTLLAMARVTGTEPTVRVLLGLPPAGDSEPDGLPEMDEEERRDVMGYLRVRRAARGA